MFAAPRMRDFAGKQGHGVLSDAEGHGPHPLRGEGRRAGGRARTDENKRPQPPHGGRPENETGGLGDKTC